MGLVSLASNTLWNRFLMFFMQPSKYPLEPCTMHMKPRRMHLFTAIQLGLFALLYTVKAIKTIAIAFPLIIACCIPIRMYILPKIFTEKELVMIDGDDDAIMKWLAENRDDGEAGEKEEEGAVVDETRHVTFDIVEADIEEQRQTETEEGGAQDEEEPIVVQKRQSRRRDRKKAMSCPSPHLFFAEVPYAAAPEIALAVVPEEQPHPSAQSDEEYIASTATTQLRRRPRRTKTMSCPTHLLYKEADRQMAENYFFG